mgnify:CR=1 FL=1
MVRVDIRASHKRRRDKCEIIANILLIARKGAKKTHIVYKTNLNFKLVSKYLSLLEAKGLIEKRGRNYTTTEKGEKFLQIYNELKELLS